MSGGPAVAIRVDGNRALGMGHLRRCLILARSLGHGGYDVRFVRRRHAGDGLQDACSDFPTSWLEPAVATRGSTSGPAEELSDAEATRSLIGNAADDRSWVVVDHYALSRLWESTMRGSGRRVLAIDDFRDRRHSADLLVGDSPEPFVPALNDAPSGGVRLAGFEYALIDAAFTEADEPGGGAELPRVLVTFGGSDPTRETAKVCRALETLQRRDTRLFGTVDVVVGPANPLRTGTLHGIGGLPDVTIHAAPASLAPLMRRTGLVITSGGNTMVEALALRKPCLVIVTAENQQSMTAELQARDLIRVAGMHSALGTSEIASAVEGVLGELPAFGARIREGSAFDHLGADRIMSAMRTIESQGKHWSTPSSARTATAE